MKLYVGNLAFSMNDESLKKAFSEFGEVEEASVIMDKFSGRSKGFGFVTFKDDDAAKKAMSEMNEKEVEGRQLKVNEAKPMDPDRPRRPSSGGRFGGRDNRGPRSGGQGGRFGGRDNRNQGRSDRPKRY
jgi:cold-inducible RNA-binding protein